ncbi:hypothetical protein BDY19DRAFT_628613 [Irpex rosettiformis]|uniref:Uncharacterized protein n=1 Tax=Irpex rosettiformis TaxID=378272 RepID=A0ACB8UBD0_9APHY|nr:hypothetical protein BDY19DRAFT_628613 [Irpex rosettiformis]
MAERELPPPYVEGSKPPGAIGEPSTSCNASCSMGVNSVFQPSTQQHVNYVSLYSKHNAIAGSYIINAELPGSPLAHTAFFGKRHGRGNYMKSNVTPNASFHTRYGQISLNLATAGGTSVSNKAYVQVSSTHGRVNVNMFALQPGKHICLEVVTRHAPIVLFVPPNYQGALHLRTRKGQVKFLPAFANQARVINADDEGALVLFGEGEISLAEPTTDGLDYCSLVSRHGKLTIGISGVDQLETASDDSLIKKLGTLVVGPQIMRTVEMLRERSAMMRQ